MNLPSRRLVAILAVVAAAGAAAAMLATRSPSPAPAAAVDVSMPARLSTVAAEGRDIFAISCAGCHGERAEGTERGPPLVHAIYEPGHHADIAFVLAVQNGVRAHHWNFGHMPPQPGVSEAEIGKIIQYVRELQRENGIGPGG